MRVRVRLRTRPTDGLQFRSRSIHTGVVFLFGMIGAKIYGPIGWILASFHIAPSVILCESHRSSTSPVLAAGWHTWRFCARVAAGCVVARRKARWVAPRHGHLVITPSAEPQWQRLSSPPVPPLAALRSAALPE